MGGTNTPDTRAGRRIKENHLSFFSPMGRNPLFFLLDGCCQENASGNTGCLWMGSTALNAILAQDIVASRSIYAAYSGIDMVLVGCYRSEFTETTQP
ncbi:hypothetical protein MSL71_8810 [Desulfoluna butyratoxydans]|uniref:Uncharacterized protein n=1 Tax=Desulfoluna butyratoxydans TaxID=231438 RepID=A0A4U8YPT5_9BACT|nr:hypothetical protein MSL71_8810 [Desulfoluna butyratoxydans]